MLDEEDKNIRFKTSEKEREIIKACLERARIKGQNGKRK